MPLLGNVVISKIFLRTRKIMVMHSNERGECCLHTLVDRSGSDHNVEEVVVRSPRDPTDPGAVTPAPPSSWHTYSSMTLLGLQSSKAPGREFRQHDSVVTILMFYYHRASPKRCNNMTEVEYGGGGHRTRLRNDLKDQLVCSRVPPAPVYKGARGEAGRPLLGAPGGGILLVVGVGFPSFLLLLGGGKEGGEGEGKGGAAPPLLVQFGPEGRGARPSPGRPSLSLH